MHPAIRGGFAPPTTSSSKDALFACMSVLRAAEDTWQQQKQDDFVTLCLAACSIKCAAVIDVEVIDHELW